jgi:thiosulfate/3-mercaptopyruvate sulfurtransferase
VRDRAAMLHNLNTQAEQVIDARSGPRFHANEAEPRPGLVGGHIPGSCNLPSAQLVNADGTLKSRDELAQLFGDLGIDLKRPVVTTCGSGVSACILALGLAVLGREQVAVYDGSWSEWGAVAGLPIEA